MSVLTSQIFFVLFQENRSALFVALSMKFYLIYFKLFSIIRVDVDRILGTSFSS